MPGVPEAGFTGQWALLNLIIAVLALLMAIVLAVGIFSRRRRQEAEEETQHSAEEQGEQEDKSRTGLVWRILAILAGMLSPIVFLLTENIRNPLVFMDSWTLLMVILLVVQLVFTQVLRKARQLRDGDEEQPTPPAQA